MVYRSTINFKMKIKITGKKFNWIKNESNFEILEVFEFDGENQFDKETNETHTEIYLYFDESVQFVDRLLGKFDTIKSIEILNGNKLFNTIREIDFIYEFDNCNEYDYNNVICSLVSINLKNNIKTNLN